MCWVVQQQGQGLVRLLQPLVLTLGCLIHGKSFQLAPLTQGRCGHWDSGLSGLTCGGNADDQGGVEMIRGELR